MDPGLERFRVERGLGEKDLGLSNRYLCCWKNLAASICFDMLMDTSASLCTAFVTIYPGAYSPVSLLGELPAYERPCLKIQAGQCLKNDT